jgi:hypothetical protein
MWALLPPPGDHAQDYDGEAEQDAARVDLQAGQAVGLLLGVLVTMDVGQAADVAKVFHEAAPLLLQIRTAMKKTKGRSGFLEASYRRIEESQCPI